MWKRFVSIDGHFKVGDPEYRRVYLINSILLTLSVSLLFFSIIELEECRAMALNDFMAFCVSVGLLAYFHGTKNITVTAYGTVAIVAFGSAATVAVAGHQNYTYYWLILFAPVAYFLLSPRQATLVSALFYGFHISDIAANYHDWAATPYTDTALVNIASVTFLLVVLIYYYDLSRREVAAMLEEKNRELQKLSSEDPLTGLLNRRAFFRQASIEVSRSQRHSYPMSVLMLDIDHFKSINDEYGHDVGDKVLKEFAPVMQNEVRDTDLVARYGGEEFVIVLRDTDVDTAVTMAERLRKKLAETYISYKEGSVGFTVSLGVTGYEEADEMIDMTIARADKALYRAKQAGRNQVVAL